MRNSEKTVLTMIDAVFSYLSSHQSLVATSPALQTAFNNFKTRRADVKAAFGLEANPSGGVTADKKKLKRLLADQFAEIGGSMHAYAYMQGNNSLQEAVSFSGLQLFKQDDELLKTTCGNILRHAKENLSALTDYGIDAATITQMETTLENYVSGKSLVIATSKEKTVAGQSGGSRLREIRTFMASVLDKLMLKFKSSEPDFFNNYMALRIVEDAKTSYTQVKGIGTDSLTKKGIADIRVDAILDSKVITTYTDADGNYKLKTPKAGTWKLKFYHPDYVETGFLLAEVVIGKKTEVDTELVKKS